MDNRRQREAGWIAWRGHRAGEWATGNPVDKRHLRDIIRREPGCLVIVVDIDARHKLRLSNGGEEAVEQPDVLLLLLGGWLFRPAAESVLDIGEDGDSGDPFGILPGVQRGLA